jgi:acetyl esterase/lipase
MRFLILSFLIVLMYNSLNAQSNGWQPEPGNIQIPIWPKEAPDNTVKGRETITTEKKLVAGKPWVCVENVSQPTMTVYSPRENNTGAAVVVFPGGGYQVLAIDLEGTEICDWLTSRGITAILLKYRVPNSGPYYDRKLKRHIYPKNQMALQDAQRTIGLVRYHATEWHIDPNKIGVIGFSAGGHLTAAISTNYEKRLYPIVDAADSLSCRPDFAMPIYPGHLYAGEDAKSTGKEKTFRLRSDIHVTKRTPPTFLLMAEDDLVDGVSQSLTYYIALQNAGVPVEMHLYAQGGHAFGLRTSKFPITNWPQLAETWMRTIGMIGEK